MTVCWKFSALGQRDLDGAVEPGAHVHGIARERQAVERQDLQPIRARPQLADAKGALGVARHTRGRVQGAHTHAFGRCARGVHHDAADGAHTGRVLRPRSPNASAGIVTARAVVICVATRG